MSEPTAEMELIGNLIGTLRRINDALDEHNGCDVMDSGCYFMDDIAEIMHAAPEPVARRRSSGDTMETS